MSSWLVINGFTNSQWFFYFMQELRKEYESDGWKRHHEQGLEFEECEDESQEAITLSVAGPKSADDKWELLPMTPLMVRNFPPHLLPGILLSFH